MSSDVECIKCRNKLKRRKTAQKRCPKRKLAAPALDNDPLSDSDNDLTSTVREFIDSMKKMNHRVYEKVIILEEEIISLKKNHRRGMYGKPARHYGSTLNSAPNPTYAETAAKNVNRPTLPSTQTNHHIILNPIFKHTN